MSFQTGISLVVLRFSSAQDCFAPLIWRRLLTQALLAESFRALINVGRTTITNTPKTKRTTVTIAFFDIAIMTSNVPTQRPGACDTRDGTETRSRGSLRQVSAL